MAIGTETKQKRRVSRQYDEFVSERLSRVRSYVKLRDIAGGLLWLAAVGYLDCRDADGSLGM